MTAKMKLIFRSAFFTSLSMVVYFFLLRGIELDKTPSLRLINFLLLFIGVYSTIKNYILQNNETQYWKNFYVGFYTSILAVVISLISLIVYVNYVQPNFIYILQNSFFFWKHSFNFTLTIFIIFIQGVIVSAMSSFIIMQYWRKNMPNF